MAGIPVVAVAGGQAVKANDFMVNFNNAQAFINGGISDATDIDGPFQKHHVVKGAFNVLPNSFNFVSGVTGGQVFTSVEERLSWMSNGPTAPAGGDVNRLWYPNTTISFYLEEKSDMLFQFFACPLMHDFAGSTTVANEREGTMNINLDGVSFSDAKLWTTEEWYATEPTMRLREFWSGFHMRTLDAGWHHIGLEGYCQSNSIFLINWGFSLECWSDSENAGENAPPVPETEEAPEG